MAEQGVQGQDTPSSEPPKFERQSPYASAGAAIRHMRQSSKTESRRGGSDFTSEILLPISSVLLVLAIWFPGPPQIRAIAFLVPLVCFFYYLTLRIGVVATFNGRQAYLTWHILIATFLMGGTFALFGVYVIGFVMKLAMGSSM